MKLTDAFCYVLFTISVTASCVQSKTAIPSQVLTEKETQPRIRKREAAIIVDSFPFESLANNGHTRAHSRIAKQSYQSKEKQRTIQSKYASRSKAARKPNRKNKFKQLNIKFLSQSNNKGRTLKSKYGRPKNGNKNVKNKVKYSTTTKERPFYPNIFAYNYPTPAPSGFAEPPLDYEHSKSIFGEPPVDSYGAPLNLNNLNMFHIGNLKYNKYNLDTDPDNNFGDWEVATSDNDYAQTEKRHTFRRPSVFEEDNGDHQHLNSYLDVFRFSGINLRPSYVHHAPKPDYLEQTKLINKPWKAAARPKDKIVVGGQYAEPPARIVSKHEIEDQYNGADFQSRNSYLETESATVSPYVNYKNSNMAFSPQNLNDAFSIVD